MNKLSDTKVWKWTLRNWITIVGLGDFGEKILYETIKYHKKSPDNNFCCNYVEDLTDIAPLSLSEGVIIDTHLFLLVGDLNDKKVLESVGKFNELTKSHKDRAVFGFLKGPVKSDLLAGEFTAIVDMNNRSDEDVFKALNLLPDMLARGNMIGIDFNDIKEGLSKNKIWHLWSSNGSDSVDLRKNLLNDQTLIAGVYGDNSLSMKDVDDITENLGGNLRSYTPIVLEDNGPILKTVVLHTSQTDGR